MKLENPWIAAACQKHAVAPNDLSTYLQEQYGQLGEDLILEAVLKSLLARTGRKPASLRYLEVGANHPIQTSNTYLFYRKWDARGVLIEANPHLIDKLSKVRAGDVVLNFAVTPAGHGPEAELVVARHSELSSVDPGHVASFGSLSAVAEKLRVPTVSLDNLIGQHFAGGLDLLSIDIEGLDLQVLAESVLPVRPTCIVAEPSRHYQKDAEQQFAAVLGAKGYVEVARTDYNLIYLDQAQLPARAIKEPAQRQILRTFDIFDTLIARHCIRPTAIFDEVERRCAVPGYASARVESERAVDHGEYSMVDIYRELKAKLSLTDEEAERLMSTELDEELANVVPIADNIARVCPGSILVTDMYLPPDAIRALLAAGGVSTDLPIVQTSHGKRTGSVWRAFASAGFDCHHLGDNRQSDHDTCLANGMHPELQSIAAPTPTEQRLLDAGLGDLARLLRTVRLMTRTELLTPEQKRLQFELNIPLLIVFATLIRQHAQAHRRDRILFAARDGLHLKLFHDAVCSALGSASTATYWQTSRIARTAGDAEYLDYCRSLMTPTSLVVDLCGTGASLIRLYADLGWREQAPATLLCQKLDDEALTRAFARDYGLGPDARLDMLHVIDGGFCSNEDLEILNYVPHGMLLAVARMGAEWLPLRAAYEFDDALRALVERQHSAIVEAAGHLSRLFTPAIAAQIESHASEVLAVLKQAVTELGPQRVAMRARFHGPHTQFEAQTRKVLSSRRPG